MKNCIAAPPPVPGGALTGASHEFDFFADFTKQQLDQFEKDLDILVELLVTKEQMDSADKVQI